MTTGTSRRASWALCEVLVSDAPSAVRQEVALALGPLASGDPDTVAVLLESLDADEDVRSAVATALGHAVAHHEQARTALLSTLKDPSPQVRRAGLVALGRWADDRAADAALAALVEEPALWKEAATALVAIGRRSVIPRLTRIVTDAESSDARRGAARALAGLERRRRDDPSPSPLAGYEDDDGRWHALC